MKLLFSLSVFFFISQVFSQSCPATGCGNGVCQFGLETCETCPFDCGLCPNCDNICGNKLCETAGNENTCNCPQDCGVCCVDGLCRGGETPVNCPLDCTGALTGLVKDGSTGAYLPGATVVCQKSGAGTSPLTSVSAADGTFGFGGQTAGHFECKASLTDYATNAASILFAPGSAVGYNLTVIIPLFKIEANLVGWVLDANAKAGIRAANVSCTPAGGEVNTFTGPGGPYHFKGIEPGNFSCQASIRYFSTDYKNVSVVRGQTTVANFTIQAGPSTLFGTVIDQSTGLIIVAANVWCSIAPGPALASTFSDTAGSFQYGGIKFGDYACNATKPGYRRGIGRVCIPEGQNGTVVIPLIPLCQVTINVLDASTRKPLSGAAVALQTPITKRTAVTTATGALSFSFTAADSSFATAALEGYSDGSTGGIFCIPGNPTTYDILLFPPPPANITVILWDCRTNSSFVPVQYRPTISLIDAASGVALTVNLTANSNSALFSLVPPGTYAISGSANGWTSVQQTIPPVVLNQVLTYTICISPLPCQITINTLEFGSNKILPGAAVALVLPAGSNPAGPLNGISDSNAKSVFAYVPPISANPSTAGASLVGYYPGSTSGIQCLPGAPGSYDVFLTLPPLSNITIILTDCRNGQPIPQNAAPTVSLIGTTTLTQAVSPTTGLFLLVAVGDYSIGAAANGWGTTSQSIGSVLRNQTLSFNLCLNPSPCAATITVLEFGTNNPIVGASVVVTLPSGSAPAGPLTATSGAGGVTSSFSFTYTGSLVGSAVATASGYFPGSVSGIGCDLAAPTQNYFIYLTLPPLPDVTITLTDCRDGSAIAGSLTPTVSLVGTTTNTQAVSPPRNFFTYTSVDVGTYSISGSASGYGTVSRSVGLLSRNNTYSFAICLNPAPCSVIINTREVGSNITIANAFVTLTTPNATLTGTTDGSGLVSFSYATPAGASVSSATATAPGYFPGSSGSITCSPGQATLTYIIYLGLPPLPTITIVLTDCRDGSLIPASATPTVTLAGPTPGSAAVNPPTNSATFTNVAVGTYTATASASGYALQSPGTVNAVRNNTYSIPLCLSPAPCTATITVIDSVTLQVLQGAFVELASTTTVGTVSANLTTPASGTVTFSYTLLQSTSTATASLTGYRTNSTSGIICTAGFSGNFTIYLTPLPGNLFIQVLDGRRGFAIAGATVSTTPTLSQGSLATNSTGWVFYANIAEGTFSATGSATGYATNTSSGPASIFVQKGTTQFLYIYLYELPCTVQVNVVDSVTGLAISGATVGFNGTTSSQLTTTSGSITFSILFDNATAVYATKASYAFIRAFPNNDGSFSCSRGGFQNVTIYLQQIITLFVAAIDADSSVPLANATISLYTDTVVGSSPIGVAPFVSAGNFYNHSVIATSLPAVFFFGAVAKGYFPYSAQRFTFTTTVLYRTVPMSPQPYTVFIVPYEVVGNATTTWAHMPPDLSGSPSGTIPVSTTGLGSPSDFGNDPLLYRSDTARSSTTSLTGLTVQIGGKASRQDGSSSSDSTFAVIADPYDDTIDGPILWYILTPGINAYENATTERDNQLPLPTFFSSSIYNDEVGGVANGVTTSPALNVVGPVLAAIISNVSPTSLSNFSVAFPSSTGWAPNLDATRVPTQGITNKLVTLFIPDYPSTDNRNLVFYLPTKRAIIYLYVYILPYSSTTTAASTFPAITSDSSNAKVTAGASFSLQSTVTGPFNGKARIAHEFQITVGQTLTAITITVVDPPYDRSQSCWVDPVLSTLVPQSGGSCSVPASFGLLGVTYPPAAFYTANYINNGNPVAGSQQIVRRAGAANFISLNFGQVIR